MSISNQNNAKTTRSKHTPISPLLTTKWNQTKPFNSKCPSGCVTGCVPTAIAQVMNYYKYPLVGIGTHSYSSNGRTVVANFGNTFYEWWNMNNTYSADEYTTEEQNAVSELMYHCGISLDVRYGSSGSSASFYAVETAMKYYFDYDESLQSAFRWQGNLSDDEWENIIYEELANKRPIIYSGGNGNNGHCFVLDGNDEDGLFHINWGWGGQYDGYYNLTNLKPQYGYDYSDTFDQGMVYNIKPKENNELSLNVGINGYDYIDLGLPSGTLWAKSNFGTNKEEMSGRYFIWREISDVQNLWGECWTAPTSTQLTELINNCRYYLDSKCGKKGYTFVGPNGNSFFIPSAGIESNDGNRVVSFLDDMLCLWSNSDVNNANAIGLMSVGAELKLVQGDKKMGFPVRPVAKASAAPDPNQNVLVQNISLSRSSIKIKAGYRTIIPVTVTPSNATNKKILWISSDENVVTVNQNGIITAVGEGSVIVSAKTSDGSNIISSCNISVTQPEVIAQSIILSESSVELIVGEKKQLNASVFPENTTDKSLIWNSSNPDIATVSSEGEVTAVSVGSTTISAVCGNAMAICQVSVVLKENYNDYLYFAETGYSIIQIGTIVNKTIGFELRNMGEESIELKKLVVKNKNTDNVLAESEDANLLGTLNAGETCGLSISVNTNDPLSYEYYYIYHGHQCLFDSKEVVLAKNIFLDKTEETLAIGDKLSLSATVFPYSTTNKKIAWSSSNPDVASVSNSGEVTGISAGSAIITVSVEDGSGVSENCEVIVVNNEDNNEDPNFDEGIGEYIDLGLPSGLLWCTTNLGAENLADPGTYYYGYPEKIENLDKGSRVPSLQDAIELVEYCTVSKEEVGGKTVYKVTGPNGNYIYFPLSGVWNTTTNNYEYSLDNAYIWTSTGYINQMGFWTSFSYVLCTSGTNLTTGTLCIDLHQVPIRLISHPLKISHTDIFG